MAELTEVVEVSTSEVTPSESMKDQAVLEFKRACDQKGLMLGGEPVAVMTTFVVGQSARFNVTADTRPSGKPNRSVTDKAD